MSRFSSKELPFSIFGNSEVLPPRDKNGLQKWLQEAVKLPPHIHLATALQLQEPTAQKAAYSEKISPESIAAAQEIHLVALKQLSQEWNDLEASRSEVQTEQHEAAEARVVALHAVILESLMLPWKWEGGIPAEAQIPAEYMLPRYLGSLKGDRRPGNTAKLFEKVMNVLSERDPKHREVIRYFLLSSSFSASFLVDSVDGRRLSTYKLKVWKALEEYLELQASNWRANKTESLERWRARYNHQTALFELMKWEYWQNLPPELELDDDSMLPQYVWNKYTPEKLLELGMHPLEVLVETLKDKSSHWKKDDLLPLIDSQWHPSRLDPALAERVRPKVKEMLLRLIYYFLRDWLEARPTSSMGTLYLPVTLQEITLRNRAADYYGKTLTLLIEWGWESVLDMDAELPDAIMEQVAPVYMQRVAEMQAEFDKTSVTPR